jgi:predicted lipoprotein with Yx(FWY)xxD motif
LPLGIASAARSTPSSGTVIKTAFNAKLKKTIVVDGAGRTVYMFYSDINGKPSCAQADPNCPTLWPGVPAKGAPVAAKGIDGKRLAVVQGARGVHQVTYNKHPLYYFHGGQGYVGDKKPGDVNGQKFFGVWFVLSPKGTPIK